jgi:hypothetical protein
MLFGIELETLIRVNRADLPGVDLDPNETCFEAIDLTTSDKAVLTDTMNAYMKHPFSKNNTRDRVYFDDCKTWMVTQDNAVSLHPNWSLSEWMTLSISKRCKVRWLQR